MTTPLRGGIGALRILIALALLGSVVWQVTDRLAHDLFRPAEYFAYFSIQGTLICAVMLAVTGVRSIQGLSDKIGRASCRERVSSPV